MTVKIYEWDSTLNEKREIASHDNVKTIKINHQETEFLFDGGYTNWINHAELSWVEVQE